MPKLYFGCDDLRTDWNSYFELCNAFELDLGTYEETPSLETLNGWRVDSPRGFCYILHAHPAVPGELTDPRAEGEEWTDALSRGWERTLERAEALATDAVLLKTSRRFTPGSANRERLVAFGRELADPADPAVLWEPAGLWTLEQTRDVAERTGLVPTYDPFMADREDLDFPAGDIGLTITERAAKRRKFELFDFKRLLEWFSRHDRVFTMLRGRHKFAHAEQLKAAVEHANRGSADYAT